MELPRVWNCPTLTYKCIKSKAKSKNSLLSMAIDNMKGNYCTFSHLLRKAFESKYEAPQMILVGMRHDGFADSDRG